MIDAKKVLAIGENPMLKFLRRWRNHWQNRAPLGLFSPLNGNTIAPWKAEPAGLFAFQVPIAYDETMLHVTEAVEKSDAALSGTRRRSVPQRLQKRASKPTTANGPRHGRSTME